MKLLFLGGTGIISTACSRLAIARSHDVTLLNRARREPIPGARQLAVDLADAAAARTALAGETWDVVVDFLAYDAAAIEQRVELFRSRIGQYIYISSASAYQKPGTQALITESTPLANPFWEYSRNKIAGEERLLKFYRDEAFPMTIVRPSLTYGDIVFPLAVNSWHQSYTAEAAGVPAPKLVHIASDFLCACLPEMTGTLLGDKSHSALFDNTKLRRLVPDYVATTRYRDGIAGTVRWFDADPRRQIVDTALGAKWDRLIAAYDRGLAAAKRELQGT